MLDEESREVFQFGAQNSLSSAELSKGIYLKVPPFDYRGFRIVPAGNLPAGSTEKYRAIDLAALHKEAMGYTRKSRFDAQVPAADKVQLGFDDFDSNNQLEYLVQSPQQKLWISQKGTILKWQVNGEVLQTAGHGLLRDMIWLPQTERSNAALDSAMNLESRKVRQDRVELSFKRTLSLDTMGAMVSLGVDKVLTVFPNEGKVKVHLRIVNTSLAMDLKQLPLSLRVHNHIDYAKTGPTFTWIEDSEKRFRWAGHKNYSAPLAGLNNLETGEVFGGYEQMGPYALKSFGEFFPKQKLLLTCRLARPDEILQVLRWRAEAGAQGRGGSGTIEWMYRPKALTKGGAIEIDYEVSLAVSDEPVAEEWATAGSRLERVKNPSVIQAKPKPKSEAAKPKKEVKPAPRKDGLLFHLDFEEGPNAVYAAGEPKATVKGKPAYEETPGGRGIRITGGSELSYLPEGNINLSRGKLYAKFKPLWHGVDKKSHYLMTLTPLPGFLYFGKLPDGRLILNMFDAKGKQHYPWHLIRTMEAESWHTVTVTWDCPKGRMALFLDGKKVGGFDGGNPWTMGKLDNRNARCRLMLTESAEAVIEEIKIWDRPD